MYGKIMVFPGQGGVVLRTDVPQDVVLTIQSGGQYTQEYLAVTKEFYLFA